MKIKLKVSVTLGSAKEGNAKEHAAGSVVDVDKKLAAQLIESGDAENHASAKETEAAPAPAPAPAPTPAPAPAA